MSTFYVSKIDNFLIEFSETKPQKQLEILKSTIISSLDYFKSAYIIGDENNIENNMELFNNGYKSVMNIGYEFISKINSFLDILMTSDTSQTNKFKYEEAIHILFGSGNYLNMFNDLKEALVSENINKFINKAKIIEKDKFKQEDLERLQEEADKVYDNRNVFSLNIRINIFNHYINQLVLQMCKIKLIFKNTYIDNN
jgi:hypothetical protein